MTNQQKQHALWAIEHQHGELEQIERGEWPAWTLPTMRTSRTPTLEVRRNMADWCLQSVLMAIVPILPKYVRVTVQACLDLRERVWSREYLDVYYEAQKEASPQCLQASDSL